MQVGSYGIFKGGEITLNSVNAAIDVAPVIVNTLEAGNLGFGAPGRRVQVFFHQEVADFDFNAIRPSDLTAPVYSLDISDEAGFAYLALDALDTQDLVVIGQPQSGYTIFGKVTWPADASTVADLVIDLDDRQETRVIECGNPLDANDLYAAGMRFGDTAFNKPLIAASVLGEVLQGEVLAKNSDEFFFAVIKPDDVVGLGGELTINPFKVLLRKTEDDDAIFRVIHTKTVFTFDYVIANVFGSRIYLWVNTTTGEVFSDITYNLSDGALVGYGDVPFGATGLEDVKFVLASEVAQANAQSGTSITTQRMTLPSGFIQPMTATVSGTVQKSLLFNENVALIDGVEYRVPAYQAIFPDAPLTGDRLDLLMIEFYREVDPAPPSDGDFYLHVPGIGYVVAKSRFVIVSGVTYADATAVMLQSAVTGLGGGGFTRQSAGHFRSPYAEAHDSYSFALPLALVYRFNQAPWSHSNLVGAGLDGSSNATRPDGKKHNFIHADEFEVLAPLVALRGRNHRAIMGAALQAVLNGAHPNKLGRAATISTYVSKYPLQADVISTTASGGAQLLGAPDGARREWSANPTPYWVGTNFGVEADVTTALHSFEEGARALTLKAPIGANLDLGSGGDQPVAQVVWEADGSPVVLSGPWVVGSDTTSATAVFDDEAVNWNPSGRVSVSFAVVQTRTGFLSAVPHTLYGALINSTDVDFVTDASRATTVGGYPAVISPNGQTTKADAAMVTLTLTGDGTADLTVPYSISGRQVVGVVRITQDTTPLGIKAVHDNSTDLTVTASAVIPNGTDVTVEVALAGSLVTLAPNNRGIQDFSEVTQFTFTVNGEQTEYLVPLQHNRVLQGALGYRRRANEPLVHGVYIDQTLYPATVTGFDRNLIAINLALTPADYADLDPVDQGIWALDVPDNLYKLTAGTYTVALPLLWSAALATSDVFALHYAHTAPVWEATAPGTTFEVVATGYVLATNSSVANTSVHRAAPVCEKLPLVRGAIKGADAVAVQTTLTDPVTLGHLGVIPFDGLVFTTDGAVDFESGVAEPDAGAVAWLALVKVNRSLRLFCYITEDDAFSVSDHARAFTTYCSDHHAE